MSIYYVNFYDTLYSKRAFSKLCVTWLTAKKMAGDTQKQRQQDSPILNMYFFLVCIVADWHEIDLISLEESVCETFS